MEEPGTTAAPRRQRRVTTIGWIFLVIALVLGAILLYMMLGQPENPGPGDVERPAVGER